MEIKQIGIIGLGLIGGSIAKTIRNRRIPVQIVAYDTNIKTLQMAKDDGIIDNFYHSIEEGFNHVDLLFLCAPVEKNNDLLLQVKNSIPDHCILTDVGSVKGIIHQAIHRAGLEDHFIGGHPMAGSEKSGYTAANDHLFENAYYVLTPTDKTTSSKVDLLYKFIESLGALPLILDEASHDFATAGISHIPHIIASSLVNLVESLDQEGIMKLLAAGGFKDLTRIASSSPGLWEQITLCNKDKIQQILTKYIQQLNVFAQALNNNDRTAVYNFFEKARDYRSSFSDPSVGYIKKSFDIMVDIPDKLGMIAAIATLLSGYQINLKNISIMNNREYEQGVLKIVFYDEESQKKSIEILENHNYSIYQR
jgi:prephenate dehydrogenase